MVFLQHSISAKHMGARDMKRLLCWVGVLHFILALMLVMFPASASAQVSNGSISGSVLDAQGAAVPDATVKAINKDTNQEVTVTSDSAGLFRLNLLPPGRYRVEISKESFRKAAFDNIEVAVGVDRGLGSVKLEIGEVTATVEVSSVAPLIENTEAQISTAFTAKDISQFAGVLENQGLDNLALTVPGVASVRDNSFSNFNGGVGFTVNGLRGRNNDQQIDGQNNNDNSVAGPAVFLSDPEFVQEYQITTNNFSAEYGRNSGSVVNIITKSGTNELHGSVYGTESNSALNSLSNTQKGFEGLKKPARFNDEFTGGTIGGPVWKDHLFFFGGFDDEIVSQQQVYATGLLTPTPAGIATLAACFPNSTSVSALQKYGPYAITAGNPTPQGTPTLQTLSNCTDGITRSLELNGIQRRLPTGSKSYNFPIKLDLQTPKNHFYGRYLYNKSTFFNLDSPPTGQAAAGYALDNPGLGQDYGFSWVRTISARMSNEFRASYGRVNFTFGGNSAGTVPPAGQINQALANILFSGSANLQFGPLTNLPQGRIVNTYQGQDNWSYFLGRHSLKAGVNFTFQRSPNIFLPNLNGQFRFATWDAFGANTPNRIRIASGNPDLDFREKDTFAYFGDDFKVKNNLTLNLGVTWSYYGQPANLFHTNSVKQQTGPSPLWNPALPLNVTTFPSIPAPTNSWAPGVGFAWTPGIGGRFVGNGKTVLRGGYRLAYDPPFYNIYVNISSAAPNVLLNTLTGANARANPLLAAPTGPNVRSQLQPFLTTGVFDPRTFNETSITPNFGPQRTHEWSLGIQREIVPSAVFEVRYVGNRGTHLFQTVNDNPEIAGLAAQYPNLVPSGLTPCPASQAAVPQSVGRVNCNLGVVRARTNTGYSDYHSVQAELRANQLWHQLLVKGGYTFSKTTDNVTEIFSTGGAGNTNAFAQSQVNFTGQEHGISGLNFPHNFFVLFTESLPFFRSQHGLLGHVLGGWAVSGNYFITSGQPYTPVQAALNFGSGGGESQGQTTSPYDVGFNGAFVGADGALRPFLGSLAAPANTVGIYAGDACNFFGVTGSEPICTTNAASLVSLNGLNQAADISTYQPTVVTNKQVRFIANTAQADAAFGTPFGNVGRNVLKDYWTNVGNFGVFKTVKVTERLQVQWHMTMLNAFNHPNFSTIDPFIDDAGLSSEGTGFADPRVQSGGIQSAVGIPGRSIRFGLKVAF